MDSRPRWRLPWRPAISSSVDRGWRGAIVCLHLPDDRIVHCTLTVPELEFVRMTIAAMMTVIKFVFVRMTIAASSAMETDQSSVVSCSACRGSGG